jgi:hypothetical protein
VDRIIVQACLETASLAAPGKVRLLDVHIGLFLYGMMPGVDQLPGVAPGGVFPLGWLEARRRQLDEECREENGHDLRVLLAKIKVDLLTRGYVEVQLEYIQYFFQEALRQTSDSLY